MEDLTGKQFGPHRIIAPLGEGGMAAVYKAYQAGVDRYVALKILPRHLSEETQFIGRFKQEAKVLAGLQHPHILPVFDFGEEDGYTYIAMPLIEAGTLAERLQGKPLPLGEIERIITQIGDALDYAHSKGLIHRDIKPSNILLDERGNCLLTDFGIAKIYEATAKFTETGGIIGTPSYMSPEQGGGEPVDQRTDIYSLGVVLYEMVTGRIPFRAETPVAVVLKHIQAPLPPPRTVNPSLPEAIERVVFKALAKSPEERFATAGQMVEAFQSAASGLDQAATLLKAGPKPATMDRLSRSIFSRRPLLIVGAIALLLLFLGAGGTYMLLGQDREPIATATQVAILATGETLPAVGATDTYTPTPTFTQEPTGTPTHTVTPTPSHTATPSPTVTSAPTATSIPPSETPRCPAVAGVFGQTWSQVQNRIGCATGSVINGTIVEENFQSGKMFWREPIDFAQALVLFNNGTWQIFQHEPYEEGDPEYPCVDENTPPRSPPTPRRGFGTMWCDIPAIRNGLGNAIDAERAFTGAMQQFENGFMIHTDYNATYVFYNSGSWEQR